MNLEPAQEADASVGVAGRASILADQMSERERTNWLKKALLNGTTEATRRIDALWQSLPDVAVIHGLRIDHDGSSAEIPHLVITRLLHCYVIDSQGLAAEVRATEAASWDIHTPYGWHATTSPVSRNEHNIEVLGDFIREHGLTPRKFGLARSIEFRNRVLVSPVCVGRCKQGCAKRFATLESLHQELSDELEEMNNLGALASATRVISTAALHRLADDLESAGRVSRESGHPTAASTVHTHYFSRRTGGTEAHDRAA